jgi:DNA replication protein DnaC
LGEHPSPEHIQDYGLYLIDQLLAHSEKRLQDWDSMPQITGDWAARAGNPLFREQLQYNQEDQARLAEEHIARLNLGQQTAFEQISSAVTNKTGKTFFLHGPGGTGKTYLYNTLCYHLCSQSKIVLCVASSGIAAVLLEGGPVLLILNLERKRGSRMQPLTSSPA